MVTRRERRQIRSDFVMGAEAAESDPLLERAFYRSGAYDAVEDRRNPYRFIIGRTGSGKSAILLHLEAEHPDHVIRISPEDLSLPYILDLPIIQALDGLNVHLDPFFVALWKHVLIVAVIRHRYDIESRDIKINVISALKDRIRRNSGKREALDYLEEFGESFWCETDERIKEVTEKFERRLELAGRAQIPLPGVDVGARVAATTSSGLELRSELADRYQRIVNETQLPRLNRMIRVLDEDVLDSDQHFTYVVIDDLDRDWVDERLANDLIRCLFRAVLDLQGARHLKLIVALRTNIFEYLNFGGRTGGQEEKFRSLAVQMRWTREELVDFADERARAAGEEWNVPSLTSVRDLLPNKSRNYGDALEFILDRTLLRPRDLISFVNECLKQASEGAISWAKLQAVEPIYSRGRLLALRDEWKPTFPDIGRALDKFAAMKRVLSREQLTRVLDEIALLSVEPSFGGTRWLTQMTEELWNGSLNASWTDQYQPLVRLFYDIGFLGIRPDRTLDVLYAYDNPELALTPSSLSESARFSIHPTFRAALDVGRHPATAST